MIFFTNIKLSQQSEEKFENYSFRDLLKTSWMRSAIILAIIAIIAGIALILIFHMFNLSDSQFMINLEEIFLSYGIYGIFIATIIAGTIIPLGSPALIAAAALFGVNPLALILVSSSGFTLGMLINYFLAFKLGRPYIEKKMTKNELNEMTFVWKKWGWIIYVIFGAIPILPVELLSFICGFLKTKIITFTILTFFPRLFVFSILVYFGQSAGIWLGIT